MAARVVRQTPDRLVSTTALHCCSVSSQNGALVTIAALLTRMSSRPKVRSTRPPRPAPPRGRARRRPAAGPAARAGRPRPPPRPARPGWPAGSWAPRGRGRRPGRRRPRRPRRAPGSALGPARGGPGDQRDLAGEIGQRARPVRDATSPNPRNRRTAAFARRPRLTMAANEVYHSSNGASVESLSADPVGSEGPMAVIPIRRPLADDQRGGPLAGHEPHDAARRRGSRAARAAADAGRAPPLQSRRAAPLLARSWRGARGDRGAGWRRRAVLDSAGRPLDPAATRGVARDPAARSPALDRPRRPRGGRARSCRCSTPNRGGLYRPDAAPCASPRRSGCRAGCRTAGRGRAAAPLVAAAETGRHRAVRRRAAGFPEPRATGTASPPRCAATTRWSACCSWCAPPVASCSPAELRTVEAFGDLLALTVAARSRIAELERTVATIAGLTAACETDVRGI